MRSKETVTASRARVGQGYIELAVLDPPGGTGALPLDTD